MSISKPTDECSRSSPKPFRTSVVQRLFLRSCRVRIQVSGFGFWVLGFGFWVLGFGFWVLGFGFWVLGFGFWVLGFGFWVLGSGQLLTAGANRHP
jgi:hypothetical protein